MNMFDELKASLEEAVEIKQGLLEPAVRTRYEVAARSDTPARVRILT